MFSLLSVSNIYRSLDSVRSTVLNGHLGGVMAAATLVAGVFAAVNLIKLSNDYLTGGKGLSMWDVFRPLVALVLVANFNSLVAQPTYAVVNVFTGGLAKGYSESIESYKVRMNEISDGRFSQVERDLDSFKKHTDNEGISEDSAGQMEGNKIHTALESIGEFCAKVSNIGSSVVDLIKNFDLFLAYLLYQLENIIMIVIHVESTVTLLFLTLIGPYVFAFAVVTPYRTGVANWFARFIQISMWVPVSYILCDSCLLAGVTLASGGGNSSAWMLVIMNLIGCLILGKTKSFTALIIDAAGDTDVLSARAMGGQVMGGATKALGAVAGLFTAGAGGAAVSSAASRVPSGVANTPGGQNPRSGGSSSGSSTK